MVYRPEQALADSVSLFTREWIEIANLPALLLQQPVSLFTREWIEMHLILGHFNVRGTVSLFLRGSGLK